MEKLLKSLEALVEMYETIYSVSLQKKDYIVENDIQKVGETVKREWELLNEVSALEEKRAEAVKELVSDRGIIGENLSLSDICACGTQEEAANLQAVSERLKKLIDRQKKINTENQGLINLHLEYMEYMINMFLVEPQVSNIYGNSGEVEEGSINRGIIDSHV